MRVLFILLFLFLITTLVKAQSSDFPLGHPVYQDVEMDDIRGEGYFFSTLRPLSRKEVYDFLGDKSSNYLKKEMKEFSYDSVRSSKPILKKLYKYPEDLFYYGDNDENT